MSTPSPPLSLRKAVPATALPLSSTNTPSTFLTELESLEVCGAGDFFMVFE